MPTSQTRTQGGGKTATWGIKSASSVEEGNNGTADEKEQTAAFALCQLAQWDLSKQTGHSDMSRYRETGADDGLNNHQTSVTSDPAGNKTSNNEKNQTLRNCTVTEETEPELDVNCSSTHPDGPADFPSQPKPKPKNRTKAERCGTRNVKRSRDSVHSSRILRKRLRC